MLSKIIKVKGFLALIVLTAFCMTTMSAIVSDNDDSAFVTKAEFDAFKSEFQSEIDFYKNNVVSNVDTAIASYLAGINLKHEEPISPMLNDYDKIRFVPFFSLPKVNSFSWTGMFGRSFTSVMSYASNYYGWTGSEWYHEANSDIRYGQKLAYYDVTNGLYHLQLNFRVNYGVNGNIPLRFNGIDEFVNWSRQYMTGIINDKNTLLALADKIGFVYALSGAYWPAYESRGNVYALDIGRDELIETSIPMSSLKLSTWPIRWLTFDELDKIGSKNHEKAITGLAWSGLNSGIIPYEAVGQWVSIVYYGYGTQSYSTWYSNSQSWGWFAQSGNYHKFANMNETISIWDDAGTKIRSTLIGGFTDKIVEPIYIHELNQGAFSDFEGTKKWPWGAFSTNKFKQSKFSNWGGATTAILINSANNSSGIGWSKSLQYISVTDRNFYYPQYVSVQTLDKFNNYFINSQGLNVKMYEGMPLFSCYRDAIVELNISAEANSISITPTSVYSLNYTSGYFLNLKAGPFSNTSGNESTLKLCLRDGTETTSYAERLEPEASYTGNVRTWKVFIKVKKDEVIYGKINFNGTEPNREARIVGISGTVRYEE